MRCGCALFTLIFCLFGWPARASEIAVPADARTVAIPGTDIVVKLWQDQGRQGPATPYYAIARGDGAFVARETSYLLKLRYADFDPLADEAPVISAEELRAEPHSKLFIVQYLTQPLPAYTEAVNRLGGDVSFYLPYHAQIVRMDAAVRDAVAALPFVRWIGPYHPAYRLEEALAARAGSDNRLLPAKYNVMLTASAFPVKAAVAARILKLGGAIDRTHAGKYLLEATLTHDQLFAVAAFDEVLFLDPWSPGGTDMDKARELGGANHLETMTGFTGQGVRGEVIDLGFNTAHIDFQSRPLILHTAANSDSHGAATSGIVFGDGTGDPNARGMLPDGQGILADWNVVSVGQPRYDHTGELVEAPYFAVFQTASVGSAQTTAYTTVSADTDAALFDFDILHCQSQSNTGNRTSRPQAWAKNVLSGGAVLHRETVDPGDDCWCGNASIGPASDNRIKPDLSSFYDGIRTTTTGGPTAYTSSFGGTSGATPIICGHVGLVFQMWAEGVFGNSVDPKATVFENRCHMTTAKALLINSARQYPFSGTGHDLTRVHQGWGHPDVGRLYDIRERLFVVDEDEILAASGVAAYNLTVLSGQDQFKATMVYADPPGSPAASLQRINDLTLKVTSPSGTIYWGNNGLAEGNFSTPDGVPNDYDTVENVFVDAPEPGLWLVEVSADEINEDGHVETLAVDADFALVVSGVIEGPGFTLVADQTSLAPCAPDDAVYNLNMAPILDFNEPVTLTVSGVPAGASFQFSQNPVTPPAMPTLTISDTHMATPGLYSLIVTATATEIERSLILKLRIASAAPSDPLLSSPANGAMEVSRNLDLVWEPATQAAVYDVELATDPGFAGVLHAATTAETSEPIPFNLDALSTYYWRVRAHNACDSSAWSSTFSFTTLDQPDYFTEQATGGNDLDHITLAFSPDGTGDFYAGCAFEATELPTDPAGGTPVTLTDDDFEAVVPAVAIDFYGTEYGTLFIGSNGYLTFNNGDSTFTETLAAHFNRPRISALFDDLNPATGGQVSYKELADRFVVTWLGVFEVSTTNANTFQIELFHNGDIHITYLDITINDGISGLSEGEGIPPDYLETDLSAAGACLAACPPDINNDQTIDLTDLLLAAAAWPGPGPNGDLNSNGHIEIQDLVTMIQAFGACP